jgi:uncharacterized protein
VLVVADSSPLIYLSRLGILDLLRTICADVVVPRAVWDEVLERRPSAPGVVALRQATWIRVIDAELAQVDLGLDPGETASNLLAETGVRGTLGLLVQARQMGALPVLRPVLDALVAEGFRIAPALVREALLRVGERAEPASQEPTQQ